MIRNALAGMLMAPASVNALQVAGPTTHADGSVTWNPPARYDRPFSGFVDIRRMPQSQVMDACRKLFADAGLDIPVTPQQKGCAVYKGRNGVIIAIDGLYMGVSPEAVIRHERGHLNGWPADHSE